jgi:hypothetical protein
LASLANENAEKKAKKKLRRHPLDLDFKRVPPKKNRTHRRLPSGLVLARKDRCRTLAA